MTLFEALAFKRENNHKPLRDGVKVRLYIFPSNMSFIQFIFNYNHQIIQNALAGKKSFSVGGIWRVGGRIKCGVIAKVICGALINL